MNYGQAILTESQINAANFSGKCLLVGTTIRKRVFAS